MPGLLSVERRRHSSKGSNTSGSGREREPAPGPVAQSHPLSSSGDVELLAEKIACLLERPVEARAMGAIGKTMIAAFDINAMVRAQEDLYLELAGRQ